VKLEGAGDIETGRPRWPQGQSLHDAHFGEVAVYFDQTEVPVPLLRDTAKAARATLVATFQGCQRDGICYPPMTRSEAVPAGRPDHAEIDRAARPAAGPAGQRGDRPRNHQRHRTGHRDRIAGTDCQRQCGGRVPCRCHAGNAARSQPPAANRPAWPRSCCWHCSAA
jgi:thiol:disulfide interchange protein